MPRNTSQPNLPRKGPNPYKYSGGQWLRNNAAHQAVRHISFNFDALCRQVVKFCPAADSVSTHEKKEGGFNRVFIFTTNNGRTIVAKLPFSNAGPRRLTTESEVATIEFLRKHSEIPIPTIYDWCDDESNEIGSEYIIMEPAPGVSLHSKWAEMTIEQRVQCIKNICQLLSSIDDVRFPAYGSLYTTDDQPECAIILPEDDRFCVGPHVATRYWDCNVGDRRYYDLQRPPPNRGPWTDLSSWSDGLIDAGVSRVPPALLDNDQECRPSYFGTPDMHLQVLQEGRLLLRTMSKDPRIRTVADPTLSHPDLNMRNIFVNSDDPTKVASFIDRQSASLGPAFWVVADTRPDFATLPDDSTDEGTVMCAKVFDLFMGSYCPQWARARSLDERLVRPFLYPHRTWNDGVVAFQYDLSMTSKEWDDLGFQEKCPVSTPGSEKFAAHEREYPYFVAAQRLRKHVKDYLCISSDGWVPEEAWDAIQLQHQQLYSDVVQAILSAAEAENDPDEPIKTERDLKAIWPFDL
ncbi:hypothetical protein ABEF95_003789 [Exophiala dermatitidis]